MGPGRGNKKLKTRVEKETKKVYKKKKKLRWKKKEEMREETFAISLENKSCQDSQ